MKKLLFVSLLFLSSLAHALTASQIIGTARTYIGDVSATPTRQQFSDATLLGFLNDGQREANAANWLLSSTYTFTLSGGTTEYVLPDDFMGTEFVLFKNVKIDQTSFNELNSNSIGWKTSSGTPIKYYLDYHTRPTAIGFFPAPVATSTGTVIVYYVQQTADLTSTSDTPWAGWTMLTPYHSGLAYYIAMRAFMAQEDSDMAPLYQNEWLVQLQNMRQGLYKQPDFNPGFAGRRNQ